MLARVAAGLGLTRQAQFPAAVWSPANVGHVPLVPTGGRPRWATYRAVSLSNPWVWAATRTIARNVARLPIHVYELDERGRRSRVRGDVPQSPGRPSGGVSLDRLLARPADGISRVAMWQAVLLDRLTYGNALLRIERDAAGFPVGLKHLRWRDIALVEEVDGEIAFYELQRGVAADRERLLPSDCVHFGLGSDPERAVAASPLESCRHTLALHDALWRHLVAYFGNAARPSGHLQVERAGRERLKEIRDLVTELYASPENAGKLLVTTGSWQAMSDSPDHAQIVELAKLSREEVAAAFQIPPPILGLLDNAIRANVSELRTQFARDCIGPWAAEIEAELDAQLLAGVGAWRNLFVELQLAEQLRPDLEARALVYQRLAAAGALSPDDIRTFENMAPLDLEGLSDVPWVHSGSQPITAWQESPRRPSRAAENGRVESEDVVVG